MDIIIPVQQECHLSTACQRFDRHKCLLPVPAGIPVNASENHHIDQGDSGPGKSRHTGADYPADVLQKLEILPHSGSRPVRDQSRNDDNCRYWSLSIFNGRVDDGDDFRHRHAEGGSIGSVNI
jgi:hypothetical protein